MDKAITDAFIIACVVLLVGVCAYLIKSWMSDVKESNEKLAQAIDKLTNIITTIERNQDQHAFEIKQLKADVVELKASGVFGRRRADVCRHPECPIEGEA